MYKNKKQPLKQSVFLKPMFRFSFMTLSLWSIQSTAFALQEMNDSAMRQVDAQDGIYINTAYDSLNIDKLYWEDQAGRSSGIDTALRGYTENIAITGSNLGTVYQIQTGTNATGQAGIDLKIESRYGTISAEDFRICDAAGGDCGKGIGGLTVQSTENATLHFKTQDGLFNQNSLSDAEISFKHMNIYLTQRENVGYLLTSIKNQLIFKDFNFNFTGQGYMYVDPIKGLILETRDEGYVQLNRVCEVGADCSGGMTFANSKPGLNIDLVMKSDTGTTFNTDNAKGMIHLGASGRLTHASLVFRGTDGKTDGAYTTGETILGKAYTASDTASTAAIMGKTGLAVNMKATFTNTGSNATNLELGHGGTNAYGLSFSNLTPLVTTYDSVTNKENTQPGHFDSGNVYINLAETKRVALPVNSILNTQPFLDGNLTTNNDYNISMHEDASNPKSLVVAVRDAEFQAISRQTQFIASPDVYADATNNPSGGGTWGLGLPIYGLNANLAIYGTSFAGTPYGSTETYTDSQRLGFGLGLSTKGVSSDGTKTTSILLIDGKKYNTTAKDANGVRDVDAVNGNPINYYIGLRNIDMLMNGYGSIGLEEGKINLYLPEFMLAASGEVAVGYLPGSQYKTMMGPAKDELKYAPTDAFLKKDDVLFGLRLRMNGELDMSMSPGENTLDSNYISFDGAMNLTDGAIQIVEPVDGSIIGLDNIKGTLAFSNQIKINKDNVDFNTAFNINPTKQAEDVLRIKNLNLYPATYTGGVPTGVGGAQRLGEMVFTGGNITSKFKITPH